MATAAVKTQEMIVYAVANSQYGFKVYDKDGKFIYVDARALSNIEPGMKIAYDTHTKGEKYVTKNGEEKEYQKDGISNVRALVTASTAAKINVHRAINVEEYA